MGLGAKKEGAAGFFKGIGKGLVGVVARPTGGIIDMASSTFQGIQRWDEHAHEYYIYIHACKHRSHSDNHVHTLPLKSFGLVKFWINLKYNKKERQLLLIVVIFHNITVFILFPIK